MTHLYNIQKVIEFVFIKFYIKFKNRQNRPKVLEVGVFFAFREEEETGRGCEEGLWGSQNALFLI